ncbi:MAG TPA: tRNA (adenosine(37)-N6)-threonylcarbamoyltransferase complex ATPase subunit type 1 TsaE [Candidatus Acidoferrales bacterium]|nr:tRNA (adenosine(37)-N6)-threonylcarbamoyltransferase complex ATPase subunit type 1 TsaE [Candidatus Acidoferrales bacterium]
MASRVLVTHSAKETIERGREIGGRLKPPVLVLLSGDLGAGKTTLTKGIASGLGAASEEEVTSPTFTLVHKYDPGGAPRSTVSRAWGIKPALVYHVDLYRIADPHDFDTLGLEDVFSENAVVIVEWPEKLAMRTDWPVVRIHLEHVSEDERRIAIDDPANLT